MQIDYICYINMEPMNIQAKKLSLIEWMASLQDENVINIMYHFREKTAHNPLRRMSIAELEAELELSEKSRKTLKVTSLEELEKESANW
jgi:hypothetical protein